MSLLGIVDGTQPSSIVWHRNKNILRTIVYNTNNILSIFVCLYVVIIIAKTLSVTRRNVDNGSDDDDCMPYLSACGSSSFTDMFVAAADSL